MTASANDLDDDVLALELFELIERSIVGSEMDRLVRVTDAGGVVVEADVAPRDVVDEIAVFGIGTRRSAVREPARKVADLLPSGELL